MIFCILEASVPESERWSIPSALLKQVQSKNPATWNKYCLIWTKYEYKVGTLHTTDELLADLDHANMKFTNSPEANRYLHREYREVWSL